MKKCILIFSGMLLFMSFVSAQQVRKFSTYTINTTVSPVCESYISLTLFEKGTGNDRLNDTLIEEFLGNFMQSKPLRKLNFFYEQRNFKGDSSFDFNITSALTFAKNDIYSFTVCPSYACNKPDEENTYETQMVTMDASTGKMLELRDIMDPQKSDSLVGFMYKIVRMFHLKNLPTCKITGFNPNVISTTSGLSTATDVITYERKITHKWYLSDDKIHLFNAVKHRDYDYNDVEVTLPLEKIKYFLKPEWAARFGIH